MKKNKLLLAAGILMVVLASLSMVVTIEYTILFAECADIVLQVLNSIDSENLTFIFDTFVLLGLVVIAIAEGVLYLVWGIMLIKKTNKHIPVSKMRKWLTTIVVFSYIFAFLHLGDIENIFGQAGMFLAIAILLTCALVRDNNSVISNIKDNSTYLDNDVVEKMKSIKKLLEDGVINEEEYFKLRDKILKDIINIDDDTQNR